MSPESLEKKGHKVCELCTLANVPELQYGKEPRQFHDAASLFEKETAC